MPDRSTRLTPADIACWVIKSARPPTALVTGWRPGEPAALGRCVRRSYRVELMASAQPCLLWISGRDRPGVHAVGQLAGPVHETAGGPEVPVRLRLLHEPVPRAYLLADPDARGAEVLRMPAGSNPSWLSGAQYAAVLRLLGAADGPPVRGEATTP